jgi:ssDNA-binding Zn-finger/Zn-ribbon topoisomerase 1
MAKDNDELKKLEEKYFNLHPKCICGSLMLLRDASHGPFLVCENYPGCQVTASVPDDIDAQLEYIAGEIIELQKSRKCTSSH